MTKVLVFGTFDIFHEGHRNFLKQAREHGDFLRVVVARDGTVLSSKGKATKYSEQERLNVVKRSGLADEIVLGNLDDRFKVVREFKPDVICLGYDQKQSVAELQRKFVEFGLEKTKIIKLKSYHPEKYKSSILRNETPYRSLL